MIWGASDQTGSEQPAVVDSYALLTIDQLALLIPQQQVRDIKLALDVQRSAEHEKCWITFAGVNWPVYCVSEDLQPIRQLPIKRHNCVLLESGAGLLGVLCDQVEMLEQVGFKILPLPECMRTRDTPLQGLVLFGERVLCVTTAENLLMCVGRQQSPAAQPGSPQRLQGRKP